MCICAERENSYHFIFLKILEDISPLCGDTDTPVFGLLMTSALGFKARMDPLVCMVCYLYAMDSSKTSLV